MGLQLKALGGAAPPTAGPSGMGLCQPQCQTLEEHAQPSLGCSGLGVSLGRSLPVG